MYSYVGLLSHYSCLRFKLSYFVVNSSVRVDVSVCSFIYSFTFARWRNWTDCRAVLAIQRFSAHHVFTAVHGMQTRSSDEKAVRLSVKRVNYDKKEERSVQIFITYERSFSLVFWEEEWLVGITPSTWNFESAGPQWSEIADFEPIFARSATAVTPSEKSSISLTLIGLWIGSLLAYALSSEPKMIIVRCPKPPKWGLKNAKRPIFV